jgi:hypothetical protein
MSTSLMQDLIEMLQSTQESKPLTRQVGYILAEAIYNKKMDRGTGELDDSEVIEFTADLMEKIKRLEGGPCECATCRIGKWMIEEILSDKPLTHKRCVSLGTLGECASMMRENLAKIVDVKHGGQFQVADLLDRLGAPVHAKLYRMMAEISEISGRKTNEYAMEIGAPTLSEEQVLEFYQSADKRYEV